MSNTLKHIKEFSYKNNSLTVKINSPIISTLLVVAKTQRLIGVTSLIPNTKNRIYPYGLHFVLADVENCTQEQAEISALKIQQKYNLSNIYITSDSPNSFRFWCASIVDFKTLLKILLDIDYLDMIFFKYTVRRSKATLRTSKKNDRLPQELVCIIKSYHLPFPKKVQKVIYDTKLSKNSLQFTFGKEAD